MSLPNPIPVPFPIKLVSVPPQNFQKGRTMNPDMIVLHIAEGSVADVIATFQNPAVEKSSHLLVSKTGDITQFVNTSDTAYGNGIVVAPISEIVLSRPGHNPNDYSISIEHEGFATSDITVAQYATTVKLVAFLCQKWNIPVDSTHIVRHREINGDKTCPGLMDVETIIRGVRKQLGI